MSRPGRAILGAAVLSAAFAQTAAADPSPASATNIPASPAPTPEAPPPAGGPRIAYVIHKGPPDFIAYSSKAAAAGVLFGAIGGMAVVGAMIAEGNRIVRESGVVDPAGDIARRMAKAYGEAHGEALADEPLVLAHGDKPATAAGAAKTVVEVKTVAWGFFPTHTLGSRFEAAYSAQLTVTDVASGKVAVKGRCVVKAPKDTDAPTHEQLLADNAAVLKRQLATAADACVQQLRAKALG